MLVYIIDGYNLMHRVASLKTSAAPQKDLIRYIEKNQLTGSRNNKVMVVFDGEINSRLVQESKNFSVFASGQDSADELIKKKVHRIENKSEVVVVTDDRALRDSLRREGVRLRRIDEFIKKKESKPKEEAKDISYTLQHEITEEMRKIWLKD